MVEAIEAEHLVYLIEKQKLPDQEKHKLVQLARSAKSVDRVALMELLEEKEAGVTHRLENLWDTVGPRIAHLWQLTKIADIQDAADLTTKTQAALKRAGSSTEQGPEWISLPRRRKAPLPGEARLLAVREKHGELAARIQLVKNHSFDSPDQGRRHEALARIVELAVDSRPQGRLLKVFAEQQDAKKAAIAFLGFLLGRDLSRNGVWKDYLHPLHITQPQADALEKKLNWRNWHTKGPSPKWKYSDVSIKSDLEGDSYVPFDADDKLIVEQRKSALKGLGFNYSLTHDDGFIEVPHFAFSGFLTKHSHVIFERRTSRLAMEQIFEATRAYL